MTTRTVRTVFGDSEGPAASSAFAGTTAARAKREVEGDHRSAVPAADRLPWIETEMRSRRLDTPGLGGPREVGLRVPEGPSDGRPLGIRLDRSDQDDEETDRHDKDAGLLFEVEHLPAGENDRRGDQREAPEDDSDPDQCDRAVHQPRAAGRPPSIRG